MNHHKTTVAAAAVLRRIATSSRAVAAAPVLGARAADLLLSSSRTSSMRTPHRGLSSSSSQQQPPQSTQQSSQQSSQSQVDGEHYYDSHLMKDHMEHLDDLIHKTNQLKDAMENLKQQKSEAVKLAQCPDRDDKWIDSKQIDELLARTVQQKLEITDQFERYTSMLAGTRKTFLYAVDAPDGYNDGERKDMLEDITHIIEDAAVLEDAEHIEHVHEEHDKMQKIVGCDESVP